MAVSGVNDCNGVVQAGDAGRGTDDAVSEVDARGIRAGLEVLESRLDHVCLLSSLRNKVGYVEVGREGNKTKTGGLLLGSDNSGGLLAVLIVGLDSGRSNSNPRRAFDLTGGCWRAKPGELWDEPDELWASQAGGGQQEEAEDGHHPQVSRRSESVASGILFIAHQQDSQRPQRQSSWDFSQRKRSH